jgi:hypothetical protein
MPTNAVLNDLGAAVADACSWSGFEPHTFLKAEPGRDTETRYKDAAEPGLGLTSLPPAGDSEVTRIADYLELPPQGEILSVYRPDASIITPRRPRMCPLRTAARYA